MSLSSFCLSLELLISDRPKLDEANQSAEFNLRRRLSKAVEFMTERIMARAG